MGPLHMEKEKLVMNEGNTFPPTWNSTQFGMGIQNSVLNSTSEQLPNCFFNPNWENSVDQSDPFESALSSIVSSPTTSHPGIPVNNGENIVLRELIGRLGSICNSGGISPHSFVDGNGNHSADTYCYATPLNSPPKLNLSMMDHQIRGNLPIIGNQLPFSTDPEFAERAAKVSCLGGKSFGGINGQTGGNEFEFPHKLSRVSSSQSFKVAGSQVGVQENKEGFLQEGIQVADKKFIRLSRSSTPEKAIFGDLMEESSVSEQIPGGEIGIEGKSDANTKKRKSIPRGKAKEIPSAPCSKDVKAAAENEESDSKRSKGDEGNSNGKDEEAKENGNQKQTKDNSKPIEPPKDYIHVRARRGQATDSHSLAERVRREKISERMKFLQDLVPGCNKVTGKAVMLDEIINYVQSLQRQVEFLSMKLATVNPRMDFNMEALLSKDIFQSRGTLPHNIYPVDTSAQAFPYTYQSQQGSSIHSNIPNGAETPFSINSLNAAICQNTGLQLPSVDGFNEAAASRVSALWEDDLQSVVQMGFGQNQPESFYGSNATTNMKVEL